jgi:hypothetical protein
MDKKTQASKAKYGTMTATSDANNDYQSQSDTASSGTTSSVSEYGTMTAKFDANNDYGKSGSQKGGQQQQQAGGKKVQTSNKNIGE